MALKRSHQRCDLTKDQRDQHIRRYAELIEARQVVSRQNDAKLSTRGRLNEGRPQGVASQVAEETGLSVRTIQRALNPKPAPEPKSILPDHDAVQVQVNALVAAWNRAGPEARERFLEHIDSVALDNV